MPLKSLMQENDTSPPISCLLLIIALAAMLLNLILFPSFSICKDYAFFILLKELNEPKCKVYDIF